MAEIKLTKNELRAQQNKLNQLNKYLPTLQLKKAMLQVEVLEARSEIAQCEESFQRVRKEIDHYSLLLTEKISIDVMQGAKVSKVNKRYENIAGIEVPYFESIIFEDFSYSLFDTPAWVDTVMVGLRDIATAHVRIQIAQEKKAALENELRMVAIRVNLFEKILIPRAKGHIKKIKVFLGDQQLAAVSQAKVAKAKIEERKQLQAYLSLNGGEHAI
ncbi:MAG: V-type ATP synthase subunit D [Parachlamydiaceae bacterium]|nr:V-type ATP synthase subunit D [Parachlamydiaceae bacterium]